VSYGSAKLFHELFSKLHVYDMNQNHFGPAGWAFNVLHTF